MLIGAHESIAGGLDRALLRAQEHRGRSLQIFTRNSRAWKAEPLSRLERATFRREAKRAGLPTVAHGSYLANLGTGDPILREKSIACVADELERCDRLRIGQLIIHPGSNPDAKTGLQLIAKAIDQIHVQLPAVHSKICLEATAGQGNCLGWRFEHLAEILTQCTTNERLSACLDTCHLFAAGYDLSTRRGYESVIAEFDRAVGLERVECIHLNDSQKKLGCRVDRHAEIGKGWIGLAAFRFLVNDSRFAKTVGVLETPHPERYGRSIRLLESLRRK